MQMQCPTCGETRLVRVPMRPPECAIGTACPPLGRRSMRCASCESAFCDECLPWPRKSAPDSKPATKAKAPKGQEAEAERQEAEAKRQEAAAAAQPAAAEAPAAEQAAGDRKPATKRRRVLSPGRKAAPDTDSKKARSPSEQERPGDSLASQIDLEAEDAAGGQNLAAAPKGKAAKEKAKEAAAVKRAAKRRWAAVRKKYHLTTRYVVPDGSCWSYCLSGRRCCLRPRFRREVEESRAACDGCLSFDDQLRRGIHGALQASKGCPSRLIDAASYSTLASSSTHLPSASASQLPSVRPEVGEGDHALAELKAQEEDEEDKELRAIQFSAKKARAQGELASYGGGASIQCAVEHLTNVAAIVWPPCALQDNVSNPAFLPCGDDGRCYVTPLTAEHVDKLLGGECPRCNGTHNVRHLLRSTYFVDHWDTFIPFKRGLQEEEVEAEGEEEEEEEEADEE